MTLHAKVIRLVADWIREQPEPVTVADLMSHTGWSRRTVSRRTVDLNLVGIRHERVPGSKSEWRFGVPDQWTRYVGGLLGAAA